MLAVFQELTKKFMSVSHFCVFFVLIPVAFSIHCPCTQRDHNATLFYILHTCCFRISWAPTKYVPTTKGKMLFVVEPLADAILIKRARLAL